MTFNDMLCVRPTTRGCKKQRAAVSILLTEATENGDEEGITWGKNKGASLPPKRGGEQMPYVC